MADSIVRRGSRQVLALIDVSESTTISETVEVGDSTFIGLVAPAGFSGAVSFRVSTDGETFVPLNDSSGAAVSITVTASNAYALPDAIRPWKYLKLVVPVQGADISLPLAIKA